MTAILPDSAWVRGPKGTGLHKRFLRGVIVAGISGLYDSEDRASARSEAWQRTLAPLTNHELKCKKLDQEKQCHYKINVEKILWHKRSHRFCKKKCEKSYRKDKCIKGIRRKMISRNMKILTILSTTK